MNQEAVKKMIQDYCDQNGIRYEAYQTEDNAFQMDVSYDSTERDSFAFFYSEDEEGDVLGYSAIYELSDPMTKKAFDKFSKKYKDAHPCFEQMLYCEEDNTIHLYGELREEEKLIPLLDELKEYMADNTELIHTLREMSDTTDFMVDRVGLTLRTYNALKANGIIKVKDLLAMNEKSLLKLKGIGPSSLADIKAMMDRLHLSFDKEK